MEGLTKDDSGRLGFVVSCLFSQALTLEEMKLWLLRVYEEPGNPPLYFIDLLDFNQPLAHIFKTIGFVPHWPHSEAAEEALYGIAYHRGHELFDCRLTREQALAQLEQHPYITAKYREEFPFIAW